MSDTPDGESAGLIGQAIDRVIELTALERVAVGFASTALALLIGLVIVAATGHSPLLFVVEMLNGTMGSVRGIALTLRETTIYILAGVAVAVAFRAGIYNIGVHGQLIVGGIAAVMTILWSAPYLPENVLSGLLLILIGISVGIVCGGLYATIPGILKVYAEANEIITTIMLNFVALRVGLYLLAGPFQGEGIQEPRTSSLPDHADVPEILFSESTFSIVGLLIALAVVAGAYVLLTRTSVGFEMVTSGKQETAARYAGVEASRTIIGTMTLSGMIAGLTGAILGIMVLEGFVNPNGIATYGYDAIAVSLLAGNNPLGVIPAGMLFGGLARGGSYIGVTTEIPTQLMDGVVGLVVLFVAVPELFRMRYLRRAERGER